MRAKTAGLIVVAWGAAASAMEDWLVPAESAQPLLTQPGGAHEGGRARACGKACCASGGLLLAASMAATAAAAYCLVDSIETTTRIQGLVVVECNATHAAVVSSMRQCSGNHWRRSLAPFLPRWTGAAPPTQECHAPQWQVLAGTVADKLDHTMHSAVATGEYLLRGMHTVSMPYKSFIFTHVFGSILTPTSISRGVGTSRCWRTPRRRWARDS